MSATDSAVKVESGRLPQPEFGRRLRFLRKCQPGELALRPVLARALRVTDTDLGRIESGDLEPPPQVSRWFHERVKEEGAAPKRASRAGILDELLERISFPPDGHILDLPCGPGWLTHELRGRGYEVTAADLFPEHYQGRGAPPVRVDMNQPFPLPDESFDVVVSAEGVEHLENPWLAFREFARVLKKGGELVVCTPNYSNIERRVGYLLKGSAARPPSNRDRGAEKLASPPHLSVFSASQWKLAGDYAGLELVEMDSLMGRPKQRFYLPLALLVWFASKWANPGTVDRYDMRWTQRLGMLLGGRSLLLRFRKGG